MVGTMNRCFLHPDLQFKRTTDDLIHPVCQSPIRAGETVAYEIPVKSTAQSFKLDIFRYTMQCVYSGECLFPCAFNQEAPADDIKVFFDYVFRTTYRRGLSEKVALALYAHNRSNAPFLYKTIGVFGQSEVEANCLRVRYENGETFLAAVRDVDIGENLVMAPGAVTVPLQKEEADFSNTLRLMSNIDVEDAPLFAKALSFREKALLVRPDARVVHVNSKFDPGLDNRVAKYTMDRELGITDFHVGVGRLDKKYREKEATEGLLDLEELYGKLNDEFEADKICS
ncbi:EsV-1-36 [Ectocarpus siliculosus]|uniref:EsV-1-36 n=1 Tax=Ectocarpus siliculosus TaxID=2880 RepID=D8LP71_ECTSI|nr:EsV-1-36 [Ectocarpus siliculosus]|eukprot:CBN80342.1 EsV-1-36 [Ectocarpus siliculosus]